MFDKKKEKKIIRNCYNNWNQDSNAQLTGIDINQKYKHKHKTNNGLLN